jgi:hypothetical protein
VRRDLSHPRFEVPFRRVGPPASNAGGCSDRRGEHGELAPHKAEQAAIRQMAALRAQGKALRAIAEAIQAKGFKITHEGVKGVLAAHSTTA